MAAQLLERYPKATAGEVAEMLTCSASPMVLNIGADQITPELWGRRGNLSELATSSFGKNSFSSHRDTVAGATLRREGTSSVQNRRAASATVGSDLPLRGRAASNAAMTRNLLLQIPRRDQELFCDLGESCNNAVSPALGCSKHGFCQVLISRLFAESLTHWSSLSPNTTINSTNTVPQFLLWRAGRSLPV